MEQVNIFANDIVDTAIGVTIVLLMFSMGLHSTFGDAFMIFKSPGKLFRNILSVVVIVPIIVFLGLEYIFDIPVEAQVGLLLLAGAAGNALVPKLSEKVGGDIKEATSLLIVLASISIISAPVVLGLAIPADEVAVSGADVAATVAKGVLFPILLGVAIRQWWVTMADIITNPVTKFADSMLSVIVLVIIVKDLDTMLDLGLSTLLVFLLFIVVFLGIGYLIGGPEKADRMQLGMYTSMRNGGIAMLIATSALPEALPTIVAFGVLVLVVSIAFMTLVGKSLIPDEAEASESMASTE